MDADDAHDHEPQVAHHDAAVLDGVRHGEDPRPDVPLQHVDDHLRVRDLGSPILGLLDRRHLAGVPATNIYIDLSTKCTIYILQFSQSTQFNEQ